MPLYSAIICMWTKEKGLAAHSARRLLIQTHTTHKVNDMTSLETNYIHIIFKYFISSKSTGILLLYIEDTQEDIIAVPAEIDCSILCTVYMQ